MASVKWTADSLKDLETVDPIIARRIVEKVVWFEKNFDKIVPEKLHRELRSLYKLRIGDYRAVYSIRGDMLVVEAIGHRRDIYK